MTVDKVKLKALTEIMIRDIDGDLSNSEARNFHQHVSDYEAMTQPAGVMALLAEIDQLKAENEALRVVMSAVTSEIPSGKFIQPGNAPGHCHDIPGVWDRGNGERSCKECGWCKVWNAAIAMSKQSTIKKMGDYKGTIGHA